LLGAKVQQKNEILGYWRWICFAQQMLTNAQPLTILGVFLKSPFYVGQFIWAQRDTNVGGTTFCIYKTMYR